MPRRILEGHRLIASAVVLLVTALAAPLAAQDGSDPRGLAPDEIQRLLQGLSPEQQLQLMEELRTQPSDTPSQPGGSAPVVFDDQFQPRPIGASPDSLGGAAADLDSTATSSDGATMEEPPTLMRFGADLFEMGPRTFRPLSYGPVPEDYLLGPGDEVVVDVWGETTLRDTYTIDREGTVQLRNAGRVMLAGRTLSSAETLVTQRLSRVLSGIRSDGGGTTFVALSLGRLRPVRVFVIGEARQPGGYEVSAAATVFQALYMAGGPNDIGSLRRIQLIRNNRVARTLDLYDYLTRGVRTGDETLRDGDTIFLPVAERIVTVDGHVRRPALFELKEGEGLRDAIGYAGGLMPEARSDLVHVKRVLPPRDRDRSGRVHIDVDLPLGGLFDGSQPIQYLEDGDVVQVLPVSAREELYVVAGGSVVSPGRYGYEEGMRLSELIQRANGLWRDALADRSVLVRVRDDYTRESQAIDLARLVPGGTQDVILAPMDSLHVFSGEILREERVVTIHGEVREPAQYEHFDNMTLRDLILAAGGLRDSADLTLAQVSRPDLEAPIGSDILAAVVDVPLGADAGSTEAMAFRLQNHDHVFVRRDPAWELQRNVTVLGEVLRPGVYTLLHREERLTSLIQRAGGLLETAYTPGFRLRRQLGDQGNIGLDLDTALRDPGGSHDIILVANDEIMIPAKPMSVRVTGEVGFPTSVVFENGKSISHYVRNAGGFTQRADRGRTKVVYPNGLSAKVKRWWPDPGVVPGSTIFVPPTDPHEKIDWGNVIVGTTQVLASLATVYLVVWTATN